MAKTAASKARAGTSTPRSTGAYGSKRGKERQARRHAAHLAEPRVREALAEAAANRAWIDAQVRKAEAMATEAIQAAPTPTEGEKRAARIRAQWAQGTTHWTLGQARQLVRDGYRARWVSARTGWGPAWFDDLTGEDGYYREPRGELSGLA